MRVVFSSKILNAEEVKVMGVIHGKWHDFNAKPGEYVLRNSEAEIITVVSADDFVKQYTRLSEV